jgi:hypothetical protein
MYATENARLKDEMANLAVAANKMRKKARTQALSETAAYVDEFRKQASARGEMVTILQDQQSVGQRVWRERFDAQEGELDETKKRAARLQTRLASALEG